MLADWIVDLGEQQRLHRADHLGAGRRAAHRRDDLLRRDVPARGTSRRAREPVLALMPVPGDVDVVIASELMEAGRAVQRGLVTPDRTTLIASTHRVYSMTEKIAMGDGRVDRAEADRRLPRGGASAHARFDMAQTRRGDRQRDQRGAVRRARRRRRAAVPAPGVRGARSSAAASASRRACGPSRPASRRRRAAPRRCRRRP